MKKTISLDDKVRRTTSFFKVVFATLLMLFGMGTTFGQPLVEENFNYTTGTLLTANGWVAHSSSGINSIDVSATNLTYPTYYSSGGGSARLDISGEDVNRTFVLVNTGTVYTAFLANFEVASTTQDYFFHIGASTISTNFKGRVYVQNDGSDNLRFGFSKGSSTIVYTGNSYSLNTTYLLVVKYEFVAGTGNDIATLYINPVPGQPEPTPTLTASDVSNTDLTDVGTIALRQGGSVPTVNVDGIRVATSWGEAVKMVANPTFTATAASSTQIDLNLPDATPVIVATNSTSTFGAPIVATSYVAGDVLPNGGGTVIYVGNATSYNHTGLTGGTKYFYKAWSVTASNVYSSGVAVNATTPLSMGESFNVTPFPPTGWLNVKVAGTSTGTWNRTLSGTYPTCSPHSGEGMARFNCYSYAAGTTGILVTPSFDLSARGSSPASMSFWMYRDNGYSSDLDSVSIYMNTQSNLTNAAFLGKIIRNTSQSPTVAVAGWYQYTFNYPASFACSVNYLVIKATSRYGNNIFVDDIQWDTYPQIFTVNNPTITASAVSSNEINLNFTTNANDDNIVIASSTTGFDCTTPSGDTPGVGSSVAGGTVIYVGKNSPQSHTGLSANTTYYYKAWSVDGTNTYSTGVTTSVTTPCASITSYPYNETFAATNSCLQIQQVSGAGNWAFATSMTQPTLTPQNGSHLAFFDSYNISSGATSRLITQIYDISSLIEPVLYFYMTHDNAYPNSIDRVDVEVSTNGGSSWSTLATISRYDVNFTTAGWKKHVVSLSAYAGQTNVLIAFKAISAYGNSFSIDNYTVYEDVTDPAITATPTSASVIDLSWTKKPSLNVVVAYNTTGLSDFGNLTEGTNYTTTVPGGTVIYNGSDNSYSHSGRTANTPYYYKVWAVNSLFMYSTGVTTDATTPKPAQPASFAASAVNSSRIDLGWGLNANGNNVIVVYNTDDVFETTPVDGTTYTTVIGNDEVLYQGNSATSSNHTGLNSNTTYYYKIWSVDGDTKYSLELTASATTHLPDAPSMFNAVAISPSIIDLSWDLNSADNHVVVAYNTSNSFGVPENGTSYGVNDMIPNGGGTVIYAGNSSAFTQTELDPSSPYYYKIWSVDITTVYSVGLTTGTSTQDCGVYNLPYTQDFNTTKPECWTEQGTHNLWSITNSNVAGGSPNELFCYYADANGLSRVVSPAMNTAGLNKILVRFKQYYDSYDYLDCYNCSGPAQIKVQSSADGINWTDEWTYQAGSGDINGLTNVVVNNNLGDKTYISWTLEGNLWLLRAWYIDNVEIRIPVAFNSFTVAQQNRPTTIDVTNKTIKVTVPYGTPVSDIVPNYTFEGVAVAKINGVEQVSGSSIVDFTYPVNYIVESPDGFASLWTVKVVPDRIGAMCESPIFLPLNGNRYANDLYDNTINAYDDYKAATFTDPTIINYDAYLSSYDLVYMITIPTGGGLLSGTIACTLDKWAGMYVTPVCQSGTTITDCINYSGGYTGGSFMQVPLAAGNYYVIVDAWAHDIPNNAIDFILNLWIDKLTYSFTNHQLTATIDYPTKSINAEVDFGANVTDLIANFTFPGTDVKVGNILQTSGVTSNDFTNPVVYNYNYSIGAETSVQTWTVNVTVLNHTPTVTAAMSPINESEDFATIGIYLDNVFADYDAQYGDMLTYSVVNPISTIVDATIDNNHYLMISPIANANGSTSVTVRATDIGGLFVDNTVTIIVAPVNDPPIFTLSGNVTVDEDFTETHTVSVGGTNVPFDETAQTVSYSLTPSSVAFATINFNTVTGLLSISGITNLNGSQLFTVTANDGLSEYPQYFTLTVNPVNDIPVITSTPVLQATQGILYNNPTGYFLTATDADGDVLVYTAITRPTWLSFSSNGLLSGTPGPLDIGTHHVELSVSDGFETVYQDFDINVLNTNDAPEFTSTPELLANEDNLYSYTVVASDYDAGTVLNYSALTLPSWLNFNTTTHVLYGTPTNDNVGNHDVVLQVTDGSAPVTQPFTIRVNNVNDASVFTSTPVTSFFEDSPYSYILAASDIDAGDVLTFSATVLPSWLMFDPATRVLSGTPENEDVGDTLVTITVFDGFASVNQSFTINVINTNDAPFFVSTPVTNIYEDAFYTYNIEVGDVDLGDVLTITIVNAPIWLVYHPETQQLGGFPPADYVGNDNPVLIEVSDSLVTVPQSFTLNVINVNDAPVITSQAPTAVINEGTSFSYTLKATDADLIYNLDVLSYSATITPSPSWLSFDPTTQTLSGNAEAGEYNVTLTVTDQSNVTDVQTFKINVNDIPEITTNSLSDATQDVAYSYTLATAADSYHSSLSFSATLPNWLSINSTTGELYGTPTNADVSDNQPVVVVVSDDYADVSYSFYIDVINVNDAPVITNVPALSTLEDHVFSYQLTATDIDFETPNGEDLTFELTSTATPEEIAWLSFNPSTGVLSGTPVDAEVGTYTFTLTVTDLASEFDVETFTLTVLNVNDAPTIDAIQDTIISEDAGLQTRTFRGVFDGDVSRIDVLKVKAESSNPSVIPNPDVFYTNDLYFGYIKYTPVANAYGEATITLTVSDDGGVENGGDSVTSVSFNVLVNSVNDEPVITSTPSVSVYEGESYLYNFTATDIENTQLTSGFTVLPAWLTFKNDSLFGTPHNSNVGDNQVELTVSDGTTTVTQSFTINVINVNDVPVVTTTSLPNNGYEDTDYTASILASDSDNVNLQYLPLDVPEWINVNENTGVITGTPNNDQTGDYELFIRVTDGEARVDMFYNIHIEQVNDAPIVDVIDNQEIAEDQGEVTVKLSGIYDGDGMKQLLTITAESSNPDLIANPTIEYINGETFGNLLFAPNANANGTATITLTIVDNGGIENGGFNAVTKNFEVIVTPVNDIPEFKLSTFEINVNEDFTTSEMVEVSPAPVPANEASQVVTYTLYPASVDFANVTINAENGMVSISSKPNGYGAQTFDVTSNDGMDTYKQTFTLSVNSVNDMPTIAQVSSQTISEDAEPQTVLLLGIGNGDADSQSLYFVATSSNPVLIANPTIEYTQGNSTAGLTYQPVANAFGTATITGKLMDNGGTLYGGVDMNTITFEITVTPVNDVPSILTSPVTMVYEDMMYQYTFAASDLESSVSDSCAPPSWLNFNFETGVLSGIPTNDNVGTYPITIFATDGEAIVSQPFTITVVNVNDAPVITSTPATSVNQDDSCSYTLSATDVDNTQAQLVFRAVDIPSWLRFDTQTHVLRGKPTNNEVGSYWIKLSVSDQIETVYDEFELTVVNVNDAPVFVSTPVTSATQDQPYNYFVTVADIDYDALIVTASMLPSWLTFNTLTGELSGTPSNSNVGSSNVILSVFDGTVAVNQSFTIFVENVNDAPVITSTAITVATEDAVYNYPIAFDDIDADAQVTYIAQELPTWLTLSTNGLLTGTPINDSTINHVGNHSVLIEVTDGFASDFQAFTIHVANVNDAPVITSTAFTTVIEGDEYTYVITAEDVDLGTNLTFAAPVKPAWLNFNPATGVLQGVTDDAQVGTHAVKLSVFDGVVTINQDFTVTVINVNDAPIITSQAPTTTVLQGDNFTYTVEATDADANTTLIYSASTLPTWLTFNASTRVLSGVATDATVGTNYVVITVTDGTVPVNQEIWINVINVNDVPIIPNIANITIAEDAGLQTITVSGIDDGDVAILESLNASITISNPSLIESYSFDYNNTTSTFTASYLPAENANGTATVSILISDGVATTTQTFTITITPVNDAPIFVSEPILTCYQFVEYQYPLSSTDVENSQVTYTVSGADWLSIGTIDTVLNVKGTPSQPGFYPITVTVSDGEMTATQSFTLHVLPDPTGIVTTDSKYLVSAYPSPNNGIFTVSINSSKTANYTIELANTQGMIVYKNTIDNADIYKNTIDVSNLAKGIYYLRVISGNDIRVVKLVVQP